MNKNEKVKIYIDGGNTYKALFKESRSKDGTIIPSIIDSGKKFNFRSFSEFLVNGRKLNGKGYYVGIVKNFDHTDKSEKMVIAQQRFLASLSNEGFNIERGKIVYDHKIREKGVDVKIAIDIVIDAIENKYDTAIIISSDTDLIPAIKYVQSKGKNVEYIGFSSHYSLGMISVCDSQRVLSSSELSPFVA
jgi:uncharacterized LabA/DUF88 family protein